MFKNTTPTFKKTVSNLAWLSIDRALRLFGALLVNVMLTRFLGPENNGILNYAISFAGIFAPLAILGMDAIVIRDLVKNPNIKNELLGTAFGLRLIGGLFSLLFATIGIFVLRPEDSLIKLLVIITSFGLIFQSFDVIDYWFQSQVKSKFTVFAKNSAFFILAICKITAIYFNSEIIIFVILNSIEFILAAILLIFVYKKSGNLFTEFQFSIERAKILIQNSWPIIISDLAILAQIRIDQVIIGQLLTNKDVGLYAAAHRLSEPFGFIPMIIMSSVFPVFLKIKEKSNEEFFEKMKNLYRLMTLISILICIIVSIFSNNIVQILYGKEFAYTGTILMFLIWRIFFVNIGVARSIFISSENLFKHTLKTSVFGIITNVIANYYFVQKFGSVGSVFAMFLSFFVSIFLFDAISKETKTNFKAMIGGIFTFYKFKIN